MHCIWATYFRNVELRNRVINFASGSRIMDARHASIDNFRRSYTHLLRGSHEKTARAAYGLTGMSLRVLIPIMRTVFQTDGTETN